MALIALFPPVELVNSKPEAFSHGITQATKCLLCLYYNTGAETAGMTGAAAERSHPAENTDAKPQSRFLALQS